MQFGRLLLAHDYTLSGKCIPSKSQEKDLAATISTDLKPSVHIAKVVKQAKMCLAVIKRTIVSPGVAVFFRLYRQLERPQLEYAVSIWNPYLKRDIDLIEKVQ